MLEEPEQLNESPQQPAPVAVVGEVSSSAAQAEGKLDLEARSGAGIGAYSSAASSADVLVGRTITVMKGPYKCVSPALFILLHNPTL